MTYIIHGYDHGATVQTIAGAVGPGAVGPGSHRPTFLGPCGIGPDPTRLTCGLSAPHLFATTQAAAQAVASFEADSRCPENLRALRDALQDEVDRRWRAADGGVAGAWATVAVGRYTLSSHDGAESPVVKYATAADLAFLAEDGACLRAAWIIGTGFVAGDIVAAVPGAIEAVQ